MNRLLLILTCLMFAISICLNTYAVEDELAFEAEDFDVIQAPMVIMEDKEVSGGAYIMSPSGRAGWAEYEIEIPEETEYFMWGMVQEQDGVSDSFFITFDLLDRGEDDDLNVNTWDMDGPALTWVWDAVSGRGMGGDPRVFELAAGKHVLRVWTREGNSYLDCIFMSTDQYAVPLLPSEFEGRERAVTPPKLVNHAGKLTTMWGYIKK
jgi:hypothetical protein